MRRVNPETVWFALRAFWWRRYRCHQLGILTHYVYARPYDE